MKLDKLDKRILRELQRNGTITNLELADRIGLSPSPPNMPRSFQEPTQPTRVPFSGGPQTPPPVRQAQTPHFQRQPLTIISYGRMAEYQINAGLFLNQSMIPSTNLMPSQNT